jgi:hypothetical protein
MPRLAAPGEIGCPASKRSEATLGPSAPLPPTVQPSSCGCSLKPTQHGPDQGVEAAVTARAVNIAPRILCRTAIAPGSARLPDMRALLRAVQVQRPNISDTATR